MLVWSYSHDEQNVLVSEWNMVWYSNPTDLIPEGSVSILQWQWAASCYHYYGHAGASLFTVVGLGPYFLSPAWDKLNEFGIAILLGGGYEFIRHVQFGVYYSLGRVFNLAHKERYSNHLSMMLTVMSY